MLVEVIVTNVAEAQAAEKYGADRLELIHAFSEGGLSPNLSVAREVCAAVSIPVNVMVRPHAKGFVYDKQDMAVILAEIDYLIHKTAVSSIVFGSLTPEDRIAEDQLCKVITALDQSQVGLTFHRAIDVSYDVLAAYQTLQGYAGRIQRVLSSGGYDTALAGSQVLHQMQLAHRPDGAILLAGSGINPENACELIQTTGVQEIHIGTGVRSNGCLSPELFKKLISLILGGLHQSGN